MKQRNMTSVFLRADNKILLLFRQGSKVVNNLWIGSAGGHFEEWELNDAKACVLRELKEELAVTEDMISNLKLRYIALRHVNGEVRINYYFFADLEGGMKCKLQSNEGRLQWFAQEDIKALEMPYTAKYVMEHYIEVGQYDDMLYGGIADGEKIVITAMPQA